MSPKQYRTRIAQRKQERQHTYPITRQSPSIASTGNPLSKIVEKCASFYGNLFTRTSNYDKPTNGNSERMPKAPSGIRLGAGALRELENSGIRYKENSEKRPNKKRIYNAGEMTIGPEQIPLPHPIDRELIPLEKLAYYQEQNNASEETLPAAFFELPKNTDVDEILDVDTDEDIINDKVEIIPLEEIELSPEEIQDLESHLKKYQ